MFDGVVFSGRSRGQREPSGKDSRVPDRDRDPGGWSEMEWSRDERRRVP